MYKRLRPIKEDLGPLSVDEHLNSYNPEYSLRDQKHFTFINKSIW